MSKFVNIALITNPALAVSGLLASKMGSPSTIAMMCDRGDSLRVNMQSYAGDVYANRFAGSDAIDATGARGSSPSLRHLGGSNFLFGDGHVKFLSYDQYTQQKSTILNGGIS